MSTTPKNVVKRWACGHKYDWDDEPIRVVCFELNETEKNFFILPGENKKLAESVLGFGTRLRKTDSRLHLSRSLAIDDAIRVRRDRIVQLQEGIAETERQIEEIRKL